MMENDTKMNEQIEATLSSLDNISRAEAPPYFYTRLLARMEKEKVSTLGQLLQLLNRPAVSISLLTLFLVLNVIAIRGIMSTPKVAQASGTAVQNFASEYNL